MECPVCNKKFTKTKHNRKYCSTKCQRLGNQRNWTAKNKDYIKKYRDARKDERNRLRREKYKNDIEYRNRIKEKAKQFHKNNPKSKKGTRLKKYGLTIVQFEEMLEKQNYKCAICGFEYDGNKAMFPFIDHCHSTGKNRGLLCSKCNFAIGQFNDDVSLLRSAIKYLEKYNG